MKLGPQCYKQDAGGPFLFPPGELNESIGRHPSREDCIPFSVTSKFFDKLSGSRV